MAGTDSAYMIFNRQSLSPENFDIISVQTSFLSWHGAGEVPKNFKERIIKYPHTSIRSERFEKAVLEKYDILYTFPESSGIKRTNKLKIAGISYFCANKKYK